MTFPEGRPSFPTSTGHSGPRDRRVDEEGGLDNQLRDYMLEVKLGRLECMQELICELLHKNQLLRMKLDASGTGASEASKDAKG